MVRLFKHYVPYAVLFLGLLDVLLLFAAADFAWTIRAHQIGMEVEPIGNRLLPLVSFAPVVALPHLPADRPRQHQPFH